jgi:hypothetical protein
MGAFLLCVKDGSPELRPHRCLGVGYRRQGRVGLRIGLPGAPG